MNLGKTLAVAAAAGVLAGVVVACGDAKPPADPSAVVTTATTPVPAATGTDGKMSCSGKNGCSGKK